MNKNIKFVINRLDLGARELGWEVWTGKEVIEFTSKQLITEIKNGGTICGLKICEDGTLELDGENFFTTNMMAKLHINQLKPFISTQCLANIMYVVTSVEKVDKKNVYNVISSRFAREQLSEDKLMMLLEMGVVTGGVRLVDDKVEVSKYISNTKDM